MRQKFWVFLFSFLLGATIFLPTSHAFGPSTGDNKYVKTFSDFKLYVESHRLRVHELGLVHYRRHLNRYSDLSQQTVENFLSLHDQSKQQESNARALYAFYGRNQKFMPDLLRESFVKVIKKINDYDVKVAEDFFSRNPMSGSQMERLLEIEKVADLVDRGMDPVAREDFEEGGRYSMKLGSEFLQYEFSKNAARHLESVYGEVTKGQSFVEQKSAAQFKCSRFF